MQDLALAGAVPEEVGRRPRLQSVSPPGSGSIAETVFSFPGSVFRMFVQGGVFGSAV
ncbi:hypothetical protein MPNT_90043 [Candidatus Methylacidithermus pantelleriae]|uniref:Uncharacterized protein n=1 Tax=Candidatus Methylacidithermus pantelleriae TaxID=2744239 RepID=A0A8J2FXI2_9BACT|nr:hypothetical protein MPNT_90043 [Candidatus Methylacidithermus pantelleriae]